MRKLPSLEAFDQCNNLINEFFQITAENSIIVKQIDIEASKMILLLTRDQSNWNEYTLVEKHSMLNIPALILSQYETLYLVDHSPHRISCSGKISKALLSRPFIADSFRKNP